MIPNKYVTVFISALLVIVTVWVAVLTRNSVKDYRYIGQSEEQKHSIAITGEGKVVAVPDIARIQIGMQNEQKTVAAAQRENTEKMNAVIERLKKDFGVEQKDIQTANYNIYPQYDWNDGVQSLRGYQVNQNVNVKVRDLTKVSDILGVVGEAGLNQVGGLTFEVDDPEELRQQARKLAIENAKQKAQALAEVAGVSLGKVISFAEYANQPYDDYGVRTYAEGLGGGSGTPAVESGSTEIIVNATVEYEIY